MRDWFGSFEEWGAYILATRNDEAMEADTAWLRRFGNCWSLESKLGMRLCAAVRSGRRDERASGIAVCGHKLRTASRHRERVQLLRRRWQRPLPIPDPSRFTECNEPRTSGMPLARSIFRCLVSKDPCGVRLGRIAQLPFSDDLACLAILLHKREARGGM